MDDELIKKVVVSSVAIFSFLAVAFIFYSQNNGLEEVTFEEVSSIPEKNVLNKSNGETLKKLSGTKYICDDDMFIFIDIYTGNGGYKADVAVANSDGQYAMAYLTEVIGIGQEKKFEDEENNSLILIDDKADVFINDISVVKNCSIR